MPKTSLAEIAKDMAGIDIAILSTHTENGEIANRPMSNNGDVAYDGTSYYFAYERTRTVADIQRNPKVALGFSSEAGLFSKGIYVAVEGTAGRQPQDEKAYRDREQHDRDSRKYAPERIAEHLDCDLSREPAGSSPIAGGKWKAAAKSQLRGRRLSRAYSDLLIQRTRLMSLVLSSKPEILGETTFLLTYQ